MPNQKPLMQEQFYKWFESQEFERFLGSLQESFLVSKQEKDQDDDLLQKKLIETGRFYNHLVIKITQQFLDQIEKHAKEIGETVQKEVVMQALALYMQEFEEEALSRYGALFQFFTVYRDRTKHAKDFISDQDMDDLD